MGDNERTGVMGKKAKNIFAPDLGAIVQNVYGNAIWVVITGVAGVFWYFISKNDPFDYKINMGQLVAGFLYLLMALGIGVVLYSIWRAWRWFRPSKVEEFSRYIDAILKEKRFEGSGEIFLRKAKNHPPFLGVEHSQPVISPEQERIFTERFVVKAYLEENENYIRGGEQYTTIKGDDLKKVSKRYYGSMRFASHILWDGRPGAIISIPLINTNDPKVTSEELWDKRKKAADWYVEETLTKLIEQHNLVEDEALRLVEIVYEIALEVRGKYE